MEEPKRGNINVKRKTVFILILSLVLTIIILYLEIFFFFNNINWVAWRKFVWSSEIETASYSKEELKLDISYRRWNILWSILSFIGFITFYVIMSYAWSMLKTVFKYVKSRND
jgi:hypothetical protein